MTTGKDIFKPLKTMQELMAEDQTEYDISEALRNLKRILAAPEEHKKVSKQEIEEIIMVAEELRVRCQ